MLLVRPNAVHAAMIEDISVDVKSTFLENSGTKIVSDSESDNNKVVTGTPFNRVKGGLSVDLDGVIAFLPGSQIDSRQIVKATK